jgi:HPt (histidine-containing phosphotransfer) domain-containing protein
MFNTIIQSYLESTPRLIETLHHAALQSDVAALRYAAHTLQSSSANLGALALASLCKDLEITSKTGNVTHAIEILPTLEAEYRAVREALSAELQRSV